MAVAKVMALIRYWHRFVHFDCVHYPPHSTHTRAVWARCNFWQSTKLQLLSLLLLWFYFVMFALCVHLSIKDFVVVLFSLCLVKIVNSIQTYSPVFIICNQYGSSNNFGFFSAILPEDSVACEHHRSKKIRWILMLHHQHIWNLFNTFTFICAMKPTTHRSSLKSSNDTCFWIS